MQNQGQTLRSTGLLLARLIAGGALIVAAVLKLQGGAKVFALSISSFELLPEALILPIAYYLPWLELAAGTALVAGLWPKQSALVTGGLYAGFTFGLASVLARGMDVDCGCFGDLFGGSTVSWLTIARNGIFIACSVAILVWGGGQFAITREDDPGENEESETPAGAAQAETSG